MSPRRLPASCLSSATANRRTLLTRCAIGLIFALVALVTCGCSGCGDSADGRDGANSAASGAAPLASGAGVETHPLRAELDGQPLKLRSALLRSFGGRARLLTLSTGSMECSELGVWRERGSEQTVNLTLAPLLGEKGGERWAITSVTYGRTTRRGDLGPVTLSSEAVDAPVDIALKLDVVTPQTAPGQAPTNSRLVIDGKLRALGCGERGTDAGTKIREQPNMQWTVAGKTFAARGATVSYKPDGAILRLSTEPHSCATSLSGSDGVVTVHMQGPPPVVTRIALGGPVLGRDRSTKVEANAFSARLDESPSGASFSNVTVQGAANVAGYQVVLEGVADAQVCRAPRKP